MMFKVLVQHALYGLSDDPAESQINDRLSFMRFLGLSAARPAPDAKTIWLFRELFVDATVVEAPRQRNSDDEKQDIKEGQVPEDWRDKPAKLAQKDMDARWTLKRGKKKEAKDGKPALEIVAPAFGDKNHIATDVAHGFIRSFTVTDAAAHDGARLKELVRPDNTAERSQGQGERQAVQGEKRHRACLYPRDGAHGPLRAHHRTCPRRLQDRHGELGLQHETPGLARGAESARLRPKSRP
jgi:IS5 family transposase